MTENLQENVARGVEWLNEQLGPDWPEFIDTERLRLSDALDCIIGQTFGSYYQVFQVLREPLDYGFTTYQHSFRELQDEWMKHIDGYLLEHA